MSRHNPRAARTGVDFDAVEAARDMTASHQQARAVDLTEPKEDRR